ncbi:membrane protein, putative [Myxococcus hansupus]|uniref:Membrane protein, putative n=1 Tax=Pseudomyxococcus hansupus TaxID=1297742 RepID=A0A0H4WX29_9BACT|nr:M1 family aminopeptidase [Myxococcus hansupus]AKQ65910.1 membrane protein, putative [Myxococcus hansupus]APZ78752.1 membrane protein [Myxococcus hansupus]
MFTALLTFELRRRVKMISTWVYAAVLATAAALMTLAIGAVFKGFSVASGPELVRVNSPHTVFNFTTSLAYFGLFMVAAVFGQAAYQDFGHNTWMLIFTKNVKKTPYLLGRFLGAYLFSAVLMLAIIPGLLVGAAGVWVVDADRLTSFRLATYLWPYVVGVWPTLFVAGAVFFTLAAVTRRMAPVYVGVVVLVMGYLVLSSAMSDVQHQDLASLLDPFGFLTFENATRYWTAAERNRDLIPLSGLLLANRVLWSVVGAVFLGLAVLRFRTTVEEQRGRGAHRETAAPAPVAIPTLQAAPTTATWLRTALSTAWLSYRDVLRSPVFWSFVVAGLAMGTMGISVSKSMFGTATWPVTWQVLETASRTFQPFLIITITFYAGELVWKERDAGLADIVDATRAPSWVSYGAKLSALLLVAFSLKAVAMVSALLSQVLRGYFDIEWSLYATQLFLLDFPHDALLCVLAFFAQVLIHQKYLAYLVMVLYFVLQAALSLMGVEDALVRYGSEPVLRFSDMNRFGSILPALGWFRAYWYGLAALLVAVGYLLTVRGRETRWKQRWAAAKARRSAAWSVAAALSLCAFVGAGAFIYYNTHLLNPYVTQKDRERRQARYEKEYASYAALPHPRITAAEVTFHIHPEALRLEALGTYRLRNTTDVPIFKVLLSLPDDAHVRGLSLGGVTRPAAHDAELGLFVYELPQPMAPGDISAITFDLEFGDRGFKHGGARTDIVGNGTFFNNGNLPVLGYQKDAELSDDRDRKDYDLPPRERMPDRDDAKAKQDNYIRQDSDFITFQATVSTSKDQIAIAPGYLEKEWIEGDRRFFRYKMDQPILNFFSVLSARYEVMRDTWKDVKLEIYHHPTHTFALDRMMRGMKDALAYCSEQFGPYQHRQARILEFPRYGSFAQAFPNTIPYSEAIGFIARVDDGRADDVDYPYYVTAHEIAHQWWAHQVVGARAQGATMTSETMAQYSALMVMKHRYGVKKMKRFLKFELDRYLSGRAFESKKEVPLSRVENQAYIHYQKGSLVMYALQDFIGEERVNRALRRYVEKVRFQGPPYTGSTELLGFLREETPPEFQYLLEDLFENITLYDNRAVSAQIRPNSQGTWDVTLKVVAKKFRANETGEQTEVDFEDWMDVGALDERGEAVFLEKRKVLKGESEIVFTVPVKPFQVGIDPLNVLIDRTSTDNVTEPTLGTALSMGSPATP